MGGAVGCTPAAVFVWRHPNSHPEAVIPFATAKNQNKTPQKAKIKHSKKQK